jgi:rhamnose transport system substrate-binding protein
LRSPVVVERLLRKKPNKQGEKMQKKLVRAAIALVAVSAIAVAAAPAQAAGVKGIKGGLKIAIMPKAMNIGYFDAWNKGAQTACKEIGARCTYLGPTEATGAAQTQFINKVIQQKYNVLVISAADQNAIIPALNKAKAAGITVVTSDADVASSGASSRVTAILPAASDRIGTAEVDWAAEAAGKTGSVAILSAAATAANQNAWIAAMGPYLTKTYPNMKWVGGTVEKSVFYGDDDATKSTAQFNAILAQYPDVAAIIAPTTVGVKAAAAEKQAKGAKVKVTGLGLPSEMAPYIENGTVEKVGLWNPIDLGYVAVYAAGFANAGSFNGATGSSFTAGKKKYTVTAGGITYLGDPFTFTKANIATFKKIY